MGDGTAEVRGPCDFFVTWADQVAFMVERRSSKHIGIYTVCRILCIYRVSYPVDAPRSRPHLHTKRAVVKKMPPTVYILRIRFSPLKRRRKRFTSNDANGKSE